MPLRIRERKLVQWTLAYLASAWVLLQVVKLVGDGFGWPDVVLRAAIMLAVVGLPAVIVLGWYHGENGKQRVTVPEVVLLSLLAVVAGFTVHRVRATEESRLWLPLEAAFRVDRTAPDTARYAILPLRRTADAPDDLREGVLLHDAFARWSGIEVVDLFLVLDAIESRAERPLTLPEEQRLARSLGAGRFVRGDIGRLGDALRLHVALHDTRTGRLLASTTEQHALAEDADEGLFARIVTSLLFRGAGPDETRVEMDPGTRSFGARTAFLVGHEALQHWDLEAAATAFAEAVAHDPDFARAWLWRAQVANWNGRALADVGALAERAVAGRDRLTERERLLAAALLHLGRDEFGDACDAYRTLRDGNERDFAAWYGLGECHAHDRAVIPDAGSPSGWAFRSSYHQAVEAYRRAFELLPSVHRGYHSRTYERLREMLFTTTGRFRRGRALPPDTTNFAAIPGLEADTLAFTPHPLAAFRAGAPGTEPATIAAAVQRQRRVFHDIARRWAAAFPRSAEAQEALALALELVGDPTALPRLREARALADDPRHRAQLAVREAALLLKFAIPDGTADLERARAIADSLVSQVQPADEDEAASLAAAAMIAGRVHEAAALSRRAARHFTWPVVLPVALTGPAAALLAYAAAGGPRDSIAAYEAQIEAAIQNLVPPGHRNAARHVLLDRPASLAFAAHADPGSVRNADGTDYPLLAAQLALARLDSAGARHILSEVRAVHARVRPAELTFDVLYPEASLWAALGDTAAAVAAIESTLDVVRWVEPGSLEYAARTAALVRAMALRAELAAGRGDAAEAARWAGAVVVLWGEADPELQPAVARAREIAGVARSGAGAAGDPVTHSRPRRSVWVP